MAPSRRRSVVPPTPEPIDQTLPAVPAGETHQSLLHRALDLINDPRTGGLNGLVATFKERGLGGVVQSWVAVGVNQPVTAEQIAHVIGQERLDKIAKTAGVTPDEVAANFATYLPQLVDKLTPNGTIPEDGILAKGFSMLRGVLGGSANNPTSR